MVSFTNVLVLIHNIMWAIGCVTTVSSFCFYSTCQLQCPFVYPFAVYTLTLHAFHIKILTLYERIILLNAGFAQRIPTLRKKLRNPGIARQSVDSYFAQRNPKIAQLPFFFFFFFFFLVCAEHIYAIVVGVVGKM